MNADYDLCYFSYVDFMLAEACEIFDFCVAFNERMQPLLAAIAR